MSNANIITQMLDRIKEQPRVALAIEGHAGFGKSQIVEQWGAENDVPVVKLLASTLSEEDVAGVIVASHENKTAEYYSLGMLDRAVKEQTILFLDELNSARKEIVDTLLTLIESRHLPDGTPLHPETIIVAAMNPTSAYGHYELSPAMRNRFAWVTWGQTAKEWWANYGVDVPESDDVRVMLHELINDNGLEFANDKAFMEDSNLFTTPRSVTRLLTFAKSPEEVKMFAPAFIGQDAVSLIMAYQLEDIEVRGNSLFKNRAKAAPKTAQDRASITKATSLHDRLQKRVESRG